MMTEPVSDDRAARLAALRPRRAAPTNEPPRQAGSEPAAAHARSPDARTRRRHAAIGARIVAGGLSAATTLALVGAMAGGSSATTGAPASDATVAPSAAPTVIIVRRIDSTQEAGVGATQVAAAPRVTPAVAAPVSSSRGS